MGSDKGGKLRKMVEVEDLWKVIENLRQRVETLENEVGGLDVSLSGAWNALGDDAHDAFVAQLEAELSKAGARS